MLSDICESFSKKKKNSNRNGDFPTNLAQNYQVDWHVIFGIDTPMLHLLKDNSLVLLHQ